MDDQRRLELMKQMLQRLTGQPIGSADPSPEVPPALESSQDAEFVSKNISLDPAQARLRALQDMLARLGK